MVLPSLLSQCSLFFHPSASSSTTSSEWGTSDAWSHGSSWSNDALISEKRTHTDDEYYISSPALQSPGQRQGQTTACQEKPKAVHQGTFPPPTWVTCHLCAICHAMKLSTGSSTGRSSNSLQKFINPKTANPYKTHRSTALALGFCAPFGHRT